MTRPPLLMGIDTGTSTIKVLIMDNTGTPYSSVSEPMHYQQVDGHDEIDPQQLWQQVLKTTSRAIATLSHPQDIVGIACSGVGESGIMLDEADNPIGTSLVWFDKRPGVQHAELDASIDARQLCLTSGMRLSAITSLCKMQWLQKNRPADFDQMRSWLNVSEYIAFRLCGEKAADFSLAGRTLLLDLACECWNESAFENFGLDVKSMPPLMDNGTALGAVRPQLAKQLGLSARCKVALGGHDHIVGALACGLFTEDTLLDSIGTAEALLLPVAQRRSHDKFADWGVEQGMLRCNGKPLYYLCTGLNAASASIEWFKALTAPDLDYSQLEHEATLAPAGANKTLFIPHLRGRTPPNVSTGNHGAFINLGTTSNRGTLYRALLEGLAFDAFKMVQTMLILAGRDNLPQYIDVIGGSARNQLLLDIKHNLLERPLRVVNSPDTVARGAALLAGIGSEVYSDWHEAIRYGGANKQQRESHLLPGSDYRRRYDEDYIPAVNALGIT